MASTLRRPVHLNLVKIRMPIGAISSIIHRATGLLMFLALPYLIYLLDLSLSDATGFLQAKESVHSPIGVVFVFLLMWSLLHHLLAGIRYLLIDVDLGVHKQAARYSALGVSIAGPILALLLTAGLL